MSTLLSTLQCGFRVGLGLVLFSHSTATLISPAFSANASSVVSSGHLPTFASLALNGLLLIISIWLFFGVRTRVVALTGSLLYVSYSLYHASAEIVPTDVSVPVLLVAILAAPLVAFGGGQYSMYKKGWQGVL
ncbi:hypothetical protein CLV77_1351 [Brevirhabdus pacifica]|uniref:hypothetical protein n=1 Tax=Brevirhabdus pacifica TaxID=1267768 RepID=UPI000CA9A444|nr:hypothetical protein [Brevirhabdus pacifica]PJJ86794.1 hypothetical protein CLV77_1351 [Brevirhabdus pacifica]